jgi:small GTP-binding protein
MPKRKQSGQIGETRGLPAGVKLLRTLEGHEGIIWRVVFDPSGRMLASGGDDRTVKLWEVESGNLLDTHRVNSSPLVFGPTGRILAIVSDSEAVQLLDVASRKLLHTFEGHGDSPVSMAFDPKGYILAIGGQHGKIRLWDVTAGNLVRTLEGHNDHIFSVVFDPEGQTLASGGINDSAVRLWDVASGRQLRILGGHGSLVMGLAFHPQGQLLASVGDKDAINLWEVSSGKLLRILEGHTNEITDAAFSVDGQLLASKSQDGTIRIWNCETWETVAAIPEPTRTNHFVHGLAFHPTLPLLATVGSRPKAPDHERSRLIHLWELDLGVLLSNASGAKLAATISVERIPKDVHHTTAKIVLVGDSGVGKTGLGWRLAHGEFKEHASTHGQQFWVVNDLGTRRQDGTDCEAILWDLAGQPDYRLTHALFLDDSDLALILFDPTDSRDPLHGVEFWLKQLKAGNKQNGCQTILVGARVDRGEVRLTQAELDEFCRQRGVLGGYLSTSAKEDVGLDELLRRMKAQIPWEQKPATVTTLTFKRIKDYVLKLKESRRRRKVILISQDLRKQLEKKDKDWRFTDAEMMTAVGHLANYGYARVLPTSNGEERVLLAP